MTKYIETKVRIKNAYSLGEKIRSPPLIVLEVEELDDEKMILHHNFKLHLKSENFSVPLGKINGLVGKKLKLVLKD